MTGSSHDRAVEELPETDARHEWIVRVEQDSAKNELDDKKTRRALRWSLSAGLLALYVGIAIIYALRTVDADFSRPAAVMVAVLGIIAASLGLFTMLASVMGTAQVSREWRHEKERLRALGAYRFDATSSGEGAILRRSHRRHDQ